MVLDPQGDFPANPHLTAIAVNYRNPDKALIADEVLPRDDSLTERVFTYYKAKDDFEAFRLPETRVGPRGQVNRLDVEMTEATSRTEAEAIEVGLTDDDLKRKNAKETATNRATDVIVLRHEVKVASLVMDPAQYPASQQVALTGTDQLDNESYDGNVVELINDVLASMLMKGNVMALSNRVFGKLRSRPELVKAVQGNSGDSGLATQEQIAKLFGLQAVLVGESWLNTAKMGEAPSMSGAWGTGIALLHRDRMASTQGGVTFGFTAQYGKRNAMNYKDIKMGAPGGEVVRVYEETKPLIVAPYCGYFIEDVISA